MAPETIMADSFYLPYLLVLLLVPLLVRWRWGLVATLIVTVVELALVVLIFYLMGVYHLFPDLFAGEPPPQHLFGKIRRGQAASYVELLIWGVGPVGAALVGSGLALVWSVVLGCLPCDRQSHAAMIQVGTSHYSRPPGLVLAILRYQERAVDTSLTCENRTNRRLTT
jgi:hypothetical protein